MCYAWLFALLAVVGVAGQSPSPARPLRLLFIGNSLTGANDLPRLVGSLAGGSGLSAPVIRSITAGGLSLEDHWNKRAARQAIADGAWDYVILQQGPSALMESRRLLLIYARRFAGLARKVGAQPAMYMVWPALQRTFDFAGVSQSYRAAAADIGGPVFAAGEAWELVLQRHKDIQLYSDDGLHPTRAGSYLAALTIYAGIYSKTPVGLPGLGLPNREVATLQQIAAEVGSRTREKGHVR